MKFRISRKKKLAKSSFNEMVKFRKIKFRGKQKIYFVKSLLAGTKEEEKLVYQLDFIFGIGC